MKKVQFLASEKAILLDRLRTCKPLDTTVKRFKPPTFPNPILEDRIGRYRPFDSAMSVTAEMRIIEQWRNKKRRPTPSFPEAGPRELLYFDPKDVRVGIVTPGGPAPGINTVIHCLVNMHMHSDFYAGKYEVLGFRDGFLGLIEREPLLLDHRITRSWIHAGGTGLGVGIRGTADVPSIVAHLEHFGVNILYVVGGDGSLTVAHQVAEEIQRRKKDIVIAGVPKTMDNDILWVWHSFGFDTAVEEATRCINAIHDDTKSTGRICLMQLFGRDAGFVAAHAALASGLVDVVLVPEVEFKIEPLLKYVEEVLLNKGYALIVVAEGAGPKEYTLEYIHEVIRREGLNPDLRNHPRVSELLAGAKLVYLKDAFDQRFTTDVSAKRSAFHEGRHRVFVSQPRHLVRAVPPFSVDQIYCQRLADLVVHNALAGFHDFMISQWLTEYVLVPLDLVAGGHKRIPPGGIFWTTVISSTGQPSFDC